MAAPNLIGATTITGKTVAVNLSSTSATLVVDNAVASGQVLKINTLNVANKTSSAAAITIRYHNAAAAGGTGLEIAGSVSVPANATLSVIDKGSQYYIEEDRSISATSSTANALIVTCSYELVA